VLTDQQPANKNTSEKLIKPVPEFPDAHKDVFYHLFLIFKEFTMNTFDTAKHLFHQNATGMVDPSLQSADANSQKRGSRGSSMHSTRFDAAMDEALDPSLDRQKPNRSLAKAHDNNPDQGQGFSLTQLGQQFDQVSQQLGRAVGDLSPTADFNLVFNGNKDQLVQGLAQVQQGLNNLLDGSPGRFHGVTGVKLHTIANQITLEQGFIQQGGASSAIGVRDVHRDILDIVNNDARLTAAANRGGQQGFTSLPPLQNPPTPFQDNAAQTRFLNQTNETLNNLVQQAQQFAKGKSNMDSNQLIQQLQTSSFVDSQGGVYSARFNNELGRKGTNNSAADQLIQGLQTQDKKLVKAASQVLLANIGDVGANQIPKGGGTFSFAAANAGA
jgi:hypothetical protein